jgi:hypothetical protein
MKVYVKSQLKKLYYNKVFRKSKLHVVYDAMARWVSIQEGKWFPVHKAKRRYKKAFGKPLNLDNPQALTEKINWLKLFYFPNDPLTILAGDKWGKHMFLKEKGLSRLASPILYAFDSVDEICWETLPNKFVIKKSNASGFNITITDKNKADERKVIKQMKRYMKIPFGYLLGNICNEKMQPKIIIEKYIEDIDKEWRLFCVNGKPEVLLMVHWIEGDKTHVKKGHLERGRIFTNLEGEILDIMDDDIEEEEKKRWNRLRKWIVEECGEEEGMMDGIVALINHPLMNMKDHYFDIDVFGDRDIDWRTYSLKKLCAFLG